MATGEQHGPGDDRLDQPAYDEDLLEEIELVTNLMTAATRARHRMSQPDIDTALGLRRRSRTAGQSRQEHPGRHPRPPRA